MSLHHRALMKSERGAQRRWAELRERIIERDRSCQRCGAWHRSVKFEVDHITPVALGGDPWAEDNLQLLCVDCHHVKHGRAPRTARMASWDEAEARGGYQPKPRSEDGIPY